MPVLDGIEATRRIHAATGDAKVLVLTMHDEDALRVKALARRRGRVPDQGLRDAGGRRDRAPRRRRRHGVLARDRGGDDGRVPASTATGLLTNGHAADEVVESPLTKREREILQLVADGHSTTEIARELFISAKTVKNHLASIYAKLDSRDRTQAVLSGMRLGIVQLQ